MHSLTRRALAPAIVALALLAQAPWVAAHPPAIDPQNSCTAPPFLDVPGGGGVPVGGTLSYLGPATGAPLSCPFGSSEWGSHAATCPVVPIVGTVPGAFCGPLVPPGGVAVCSFSRYSNTVWTYLYAGWDLPPYDGRINKLVSGESPVYGSILDNSVAVIPNLSAVSARIIAYPTAVFGVIAPGDINLVLCV
jgi:hypothetical protein